MRLLTSELLLALCGGLLIGLTAFGMALPQPVIGQFGIGYGRALDQFVFLVCGQGLVYFVAVTIVLRTKLRGRIVWGVLVGAACLRLLVVVFPPFLSNDIYRYIWDGWVQGAGINPYRYIPADPRLSFLRDTAVFPNINRANYAHTIYPPAAEMIFCLIASIAKIAMAPPLLTMKIAMLAFEAGGIWAMVHLLDHAGLPRARVLIYAWNPVPVWEFAGSGHVDAITIFFIAVALLAACQARRSLSAVALSAAVLTKFLPAILLPALWRRGDWKFGAIFLGIAVALYAPYLGVGEAVLGFLGGYNAQEGIDSGTGIFLLSLLSRVVALPADASKIYLVVLALLYTALGFVMVFGKALPHGAQAQSRIIAKRCLLLGCVLLVGISPHYPWYYCWLLLPACIMPRPSVLYLVTASFLLYLNPTHVELFWPALLYGPFLILVWLDIWPRKLTVPIPNPSFVEGDRT